MIDWEAYQYVALFQDLDVPHTNADKNLYLATSQDLATISKKWVSRYENKEKEVYQDVATSQDLDVPPENI